MPVDDDIAALLAEIGDSQVPPGSDGAVAQARRDFRKRLFERRDDLHLAAVASVTDTELAGVPVRVYRPLRSGAAPTVVFMHGGGWMIGDLDTHDASCRLLCRDVGAVVVSVGYRLAPEHPFPAGLDDTYAVLTHVQAHLGDFGRDDRLGLAGDSAGGNLAAVGAQLAEADGLPVQAQLLVYPAVDLTGRYESARENATGYLLTADEMRWFTQAYLRGASPRDPRVAPLHGELAGLPPAVVVTAQYDPLRDQGNAYASALAGAGVRVVHREFEGLIHGFYGMETISSAAAEATDWTHARFAELLSSS